MILVRQTLSDRDASFGASCGHAQDEQRFQPLVDLVVLLREEVRGLQEQLEVKQTRLRLAEATLEMLGQGEHETCRLGSAPTQTQEGEGTENLLRAQASKRMFSLGVPVWP
jgi:hypothetical protein